MMCSFRSQCCITIYINAYRSQRYAYLALDNGNLSIMKNLFSRIKIFLDIFSIHSILKIFSVNYPTLGVLFIISLWVFDVSESKLKKKCVLYSTVLNSNKQFRNIFKFRTFPFNALHRFNKTNEREYFKTSIRERGYKINHFVRNDFEIWNFYICLPFDEKYRCRYRDGLRKLR